jgi:DNA-binding transcriptional MerR regulator
VKKLFDQREIARLLGISESRVRRWERQGLVPRLKKTGGALWFDFQGLVAFRTVRQLRGQGLSLAKIGKCVAKLRRLMPQLKQPLSEVRISLHRQQIVLGRDRLQITPEGQRLIDFGGPENLAIPLARQDWERLFSQALGLDPDHVEGNYNLANLLEGRGELASAAAFYRKALRRDPEFADGHFNLAMVLERMGDLSGARSHWRRFLSLNPASQWAGYVRSRLGEG